MLKAYKVELDPNNKQKAFLGRCVGASRYVYNWGLAEWKRQYEAGEKPSAYRLCVQFNAVKDELCPWIRELPYAVTESAFGNLGKAFDNFFRRIKNKAEKAGYPKFKKRGIKSSFQVRNAKIEPDRVRITGIGWIRLKQKDYIPAEADKYGVYATISERAGRWFISVLVYENDPELPKVNGVIGVDVGIKALAVDSTGIFYSNPKAGDRYSRKLARLQRELHRRKLGSQNRKKTKEKISKLYYRISNVRENALHHASTCIINKKPAVIVLEDLNVAGMLKNHHIARAMSDASVSELHRQITYKAERIGAKVVKADRWFASSKTCSNCGCIDSDLKLSDRIYQCRDCGLEIDRDLNAARNLAALGEPLNGRGLPGELTGLDVTMNQEPGISNE